MDVLKRPAQLLTPFMAEGRRDTLLTLAFHAAHRKVYDKIPQRGATADFVVNCVRSLLEQGCLGSRHALSVLLEAVRGAAGDELQGEFQSVIDELDHHCRKAAPGAAGHPIPVIETAAQALANYRQSLLDELSERYQVDNRFVRLRLLDMERS